MFFVIEYMCLPSEIAFELKTLRVLFLTI